MKIRLPTVFAAILAAAAGAQVPQGAPQPVPHDDAIPAAADVPFPGMLKVAIDATDTTRGIFRVTETIPVAAAGPLTLLYPKWLPGSHNPEGQIASMAGLTITAAGKPLAWKRDPVDVDAFTVQVPADVRQVEARFQFLGATVRAQGRIVTTPDMLNLQFIAQTLYPAGYFARRIPVQASVTYPEGFRAATALEVASTAGNTVTYKPVSYDVLADSPVYAGRYFRREQLCPKVHLNVVGDTPAAIEIGPDVLQAHRNLCAQAVKLFGAQHYDHYDFLLSVSDLMSGNGLEHHRSSEDGVGRGYFTEWDQHLRDHDLLPHEYTHSWNGKYRRGADLWTPDYRTPMRDSLLWVYEGQTQFWGHVLSARSGLLSKQDVLDELASDAAEYDNVRGREWRTVEDTTNDPLIAQRRPKPWVNWQRSEDYYVEGALTWLDVNAVLAEQSHGAKSMNDFARAFFGMNDGDYGELTYGFDDVVKTLNAVQPYDWATFLRQRIFTLRPHAPLDWIAKAGYRLDYTAEASKWIKDAEKQRKIVDLTYSLGVTIDKDAAVASVVWDGIAFDQGITVGTTILAIDGRAYSDEAIRAAITDAARTRRPIALLIKQGDRFRTVQLAAFGGLRYPHLVKVAAGDGTLDRLLAPLP